MIIYNVIWEDRHEDITVTSFLDRDKAIAYAKVNAKDNVSNGYYREIDIDGREFYAAYSWEQDSIWVVKNKVRE